MKIKLQKIRPRNILTILAEIATIVSMVLAWSLSRNQNQQQANTNPTIGPIIYVFIIVNVIMFVFLSVTILRSIIIHINGKQYLLQKMFESFVSSPSRYLTDMKRDRIEEYNKLIERTKRALTCLDDSQSFDEDVYYMLLYSLFYSANGAVNVVSILDDLEWIDTPEEDEFLRLNLALVEKKIHLNRIFVVDKADVAKKLNTKSIQSFLEADHTYIHLFVVFRDVLSRNLINDIGSGFIEFFGFIVACDIFADNIFRGILRPDPKEVERYNKLYMKLTEHYVPLNQEFKKLYFLASAAAIDAEKKVE